MVKAELMYSSKDTTESKKKATNGENIFIIHAADKELVSRIHKECLQTNKKRTNNAIKMGKGLEQALTKEDILQADKHRIIREMQTKTVRYSLE